MMHITRKKFWQYLLDNRGQAGEDDEDVVDDDVVDDDDTMTYPPDDDTEVPGDDDTATGDDTAGQSPEPDQVDDDPTPDPTSLLLEKVAALEEKLSSFTTQPQTQQTPPTTEDDDSPRHLVVEYDDPSHAFHKKTLGQIYDVDPREAFRVDPYLAGKIQQEEMMREQAASEQDKALEEQVRKEQQEFADEFARSEFDADFDKLSPTQQAEVGKMSDKVMDWMVSNNKYGITLNEAYFLMDRAGALSKAASKIVKDASRGNVRTVSSKRDTGADVKSNDMTRWTDQQMFDHLDSLSEAAYDKFLSTAPKSVQEKFPSLPWG
jgi:hypothetical protein